MDTYATHTDLWEHELWVIALCLRAGMHVSWTELGRAFECLVRSVRPKARA